MVLCNMERAGGVIAGDDREILPPFRTQPNLTSPPARAVPSPMESEFSSTLELADLPEDMQLVARVAGIEVARLIMEKLGGSRLYVPLVSRVSRPAIIRFVQARYNVDDGRHNLKALARAIGIRERSLLIILQEEGVSLPSRQAVRKSSHGRRPS